MYKVTSRHNGHVTYQVGHVAVMPKTVDALSGVERPAREVFVADKSYDNERDARTGLRKAVIDAQKTHVAKPKRVRRKRAQTVSEE